MFSKKVALVAAIAVVALVGTVCVFAPESTELFRAHGPVLRSPVDMAWRMWKVQQGKTYGGPEEKSRFAVFKMNYDIVQQHNAQGKNYTLGLNQFADLTNKEFAALYLGASTAMMNASNTCATPNSTVGAISVADTLDWRTQGRVGPVKDQGQCGSCWAFSTVGSLEGLSAAQGKLGDFAEQELVDCTTGYGNYGCGGGWVQNAYHYVIASGIANEADYTYTATDGTCQTGLARADVKINGCVNVEPQSVDALKEALQNGPVSVYVEADQSAFQLYQSGVVDDASCYAEGAIDHAVLAVGYTDNAWIVKNSWASSWGDQGYIYISMETKTNPKGICGILSIANTYPVNN